MTMFSPGMRYIDHESVSESMLRTGSAGSSTAASPVSSRDTVRGDGVPGCGGPACPGEGAGSRRTVLFRPDYFVRYPNIVYTVSL